MRCDVTMLILRVPSDQIQNVDATTVEHASGQSGRSGQRLPGLMRTLVEFTSEIITHDAARKLSQCGQIISHVDFQLRGGPNTSTWPPAGSRSMSSWP